MRKITDKQAKVLDTIKVYIKNTGYPPSFREIGTRLNLSSSATVQQHLNSLKKKGYVTWEPGRSRTLTIIEKNQAGTCNI